MKDEEEISFFTTTSAQMQEMYREFSELSKKKPDCPINTFKLSLINKILNDANSILENGYKPFEHFTIFDEDDLPTNSDVIIVLSQYQNAMEKFRCDNIQKDFSRDWYWVIDGDLSTIKTTAPSTKFKQYF